MHEGSSNDEMGVKNIAEINDGNLSSNTMINGKVLSLLDYAKDVRHECQRRTSSFRDLNAKALLGENTSLRRAKVMSLLCHILRWYGIEAALIGARHRLAKCVVDSRLPASP